MVDFELVLQLVYNVGNSRFLTIANEHGGWAKQELSSRHTTELFGSGRQEASARAKQTEKSKQRSRVKIGEGGEEGENLSCPSQEKNKQCTIGGGNL